MTRIPPEGDGAPEAEIAAYRRRLDAERSQLRPNLDGVLQRAEALARGQAQSDDLPDRPDPRLAEHVAAYRAHLDEGRRRLAATPPQAPTRYGGFAWRSVAVASMSFAAALLLLWWSASPESALQWWRSEDPNMASAHSRLERIQHASHKSTRRRPTADEVAGESATTSASRTADESQDDTGVEANEGDQNPQLGTFSEIGGGHPQRLAPGMEHVQHAGRSVPSESERPRRRLSLEQRIAQLDRLARKRWRAGQLRSAEQTFRKIIDIGGRSKAVELAFAELFALQRQRGHSSKRIWRQYLRKFPKGRYAEDASAGLCRSLKPQSEGAKRCWTQFSTRYPGSSFLPDDF